MRAQLFKKERELLEKERVLNERGYQGAGGLGTMDRKTRDALTAELENEENLRIQRRLRQLENEERNAEEENRRRTMGGQERMERERHEREMAELRANI